MKTIHDKRYIGVITRLRQARIDANMSQAEVAQAMGWCRSAVSDIETRERRLDLLETYLLCELYEISVNDLVAVLQEADQPTRRPSSPPGGKEVMPID